MSTTQKQLILLALAPCIAWGVITWACIIYGYKLNGLKGLSDYHIYRIMYLLRTFIFMLLLLWIYKMYVPTLYQDHRKMYIGCSIAAVLSLVGGAWVKTKFWNYMLDGCLVSPLLEELIARFILYAARNQGFKMYVLVALLSSLAFGLMHFGYDYSSLLDNSVLVPIQKLSEHVGFSLVLCGVFWFVPRLSLLILIHALSNLHAILITASELGF